MNEIIASLTNKQLVWRAGRSTQERDDYITTGYRQVDQALGGGWPAVGVTEINGEWGIGELRLLLPSLQAHGKDKEKLLVFIAPPWHINAEMLYQQGFELANILIVNSEHNAALWSAEQCLKSGCCAAVLVWHEQLHIHQVKRLQLACEKGQAVSFIFNRRRLQGLPFSLSLGLCAHHKGIEVRVNKRKGGWPQASFIVDMHEQWPKLSVRHTPQALTSCELVKASV